MNKLLAKHEQAMNELEVLKKHIECTGDICKKVPVVPKYAYDSWLSSVKQFTKYQTTEELQLIQRRFNVLCNMLFSDKGQYMMWASNYKHDMIHYTDNHLYCEFGHVEPHSIDDQHRNAFFTIREYLKNTDKPIIIANTTDLTFTKIWKYYMNATQKQHIAAYLLLETFEKPPIQIIVNPSSTAVRLICKLVCSMLDSETRNLITIN